MTALRKNSGGHYWRPERTRSERMKSATITLAPKTRKRRQPPAVPPPKDWPEFLDTLEHGYGDGTGWLR